MTPARPSAPDAMKATRRFSGGFTLIEMSISIALVGIVSSALMSAFLLALKAIPADNDPGITAARADAAFEFLLADAMLASTASSSGQKLTMTVPDQTGDAAAETVVYQIDSNQLQRVMNSGDPRVLIDGVGKGSFVISAADDRAYRLTVVIVTETGQTHRAGTEFLARPEVR